MKILKIGLLLAFLAIINNFLFGAMVESTGHLARTLPSVGFGLPKYGRIPASRGYQPGLSRVYGTEAQKSISAYEALLQRKQPQETAAPPKDWNMAKRRLYGIAGLATGAAGAYGSMTLYQKIKEAEAKKHEEVLRAEMNQQKELQKAFFDDLENSKEYGQAFNFTDVPAAYREYVLEQYKNRVIQEGVELGKYIPETNLSDVLLLAKDSLKKRYELWKALLERKYVYKILISPEQIAQVEHKWFESGKSVEEFLNSEGKETFQEEQAMIKRYKNLYGIKTRPEKKWFRGTKEKEIEPSLDTIKAALPESTQNLVTNYEEYINTWKTEGEKELELLRIRKYYKPKIIKRPTAESVIGESLYK